MKDRCLSSAPSLVSIILPELAHAAHDELVPVRQVLAEALRPTTLVILSCPPSATLPVLLIFVAVHLPLVFFLL